MLFTALIAIAATGPQAVTLEDGNTVYLSYVSDAPLKRAWRPDGTPAKSYVDPRTNDGDIWRSRLDPGELQLVFTLNLRHSPKDDRFSAWQPNFSQINTSDIVRHGVAIYPCQIGKDVYQCGRDLTKPKNGKPFDVTIHVTDTLWETVAQAKFRNGKKVSGDSAISAPTLVPGMSPKVDPIYRQGFPVQLPAKWKGYEYRFFAFGKPDQFIGPGSSIRTRSGAEYDMFRGQYKDVNRIELQVRPFKTVRFKNVHATPNR